MGKILGPIYYPTASASARFDDPDVMAASLPGGRFGVLPLERQPFRAAVRIVELGHGLSARGVQTESAVAIRSEFAGINSTITYMLPSVEGDAALFDGQDVDGTSLVARVAGQAPTLRTYGRHEIGALTIMPDVLLQAADATIGQARAPFLTTPGAIRGKAPVRIARLRLLFKTVVGMLEHYESSDLSVEKLPALQLLRDELLALLVHVLRDDPPKQDHLARQRQTITMAKIERYLDDHTETIVGLQDLCRGTGLPLRTIETIIRSRNDLPALEYLRRRRLASVRNCLLMPEANTTITSAATRFGFWHLGRFSGYYMQIYGELPSTTLQRAR